MGIHYLEYKENSCGNDTRSYRFRILLGQIGALVNELTYYICPWMIVAYLSDFGDNYAIVILLLTTPNPLVLKPLISLYLFVIIVIMA